jgi:hypothetical protein
MAYKMHLKIRKGINVIRKRWSGKAKTQQDKNKKRERNHEVPRSRYQVLETGSYL